MYEVLVGYSEWRGGDYNGSWMGGSRNFKFRTLDNAKKFVIDVNSNKKLTHLMNASAYPPQKVETED